MKKTFYSIITFAIFMLAVTAAFSVSADEKSNGKSKGVVKTIEKAIDKLTKWEEKDFKFNEQDFNKGNVPETLNIGPKGHARITAGKVSAVGNGTVVVSVWKMSFTVHKMPETKVLARGGGNSTFESIKMGDVVDVNGVLDGDKVMFIHAEVIHNRSTVSAEREEQISKLRAQIQEMIERLNKLLGKTTPPATPPSSSELKIGDLVMTTATVNVTTDPLTDPAMVLGSQATSTQGVIISGPRAVSGTNWWEINFDSGADGYVNSGHLKKN